MNHLLRTFVLTLAVGATALSSVSSAHADEWRRRYYDGPPPVERHHRHGEAAALGVIGLATGLIVGSAIASQPQQSGPVYNAYPADPYRRSPPPPPPAYYGNRDYYPDTPRSYSANAGYYRPQPTLEPWSRSWYNYCANRYRSFDANSGTYVGYDGARHFCTAN